MPEADGYKVVNNVEKSNSWILLAGIVIVWGVKLLFAGRDTVTVAD